MLSRSQIQQTEPRIRVLRMLCLGLIIGAIALALVLYLVRENPKFNSQLGLLQWVGIGFALTELGPALVVPVVMRANSVSQVGRSNERLASDVYVSIGLVGGFVSSVIIQFALFQGALLANLFFWLMEGSVYNLAASGFCLACMIVLFPGMDRSLGTVSTMQRDAASNQPRT